MPKVTYRRYQPNPLEEIDPKDLMDQLRDFFLQSGFESQLGTPGSGEGMESLKWALARLLQDSPLIPEHWQEQLADYAEDPHLRLDADLEDFLEALIGRLVEEGFLKAIEAPPGPAEEGSGTEATPQPLMRFELTLRGIDFLGYKTLRHLLGSLGESTFGLHWTDKLTTDIAADSASRRYQFGDTLNIDINRTLLSSLQRRGLKLPLEIEYEDLHVHQTEFHSSCATVLMLDCSHSMILYGEDRFTPAKRVALGLAHLIRTRFPGDTLDVVLFHDSAQQVPLHQLAQVKVGPYHTNTCEGLRLARRILMNRRKEMRQIIMITDGKPSAVTLPDGRIYRNPFGLDPMILRETFREVGQCRRSRILINTFMVARDYHLVEFVKRVSQICQGKAYFTNTRNLARYLLLDFMNKKSRTVH